MKTKAFMLYTALGCLVIFVTAGFVGLPWYIAVIPAAIWNLGIFLYFWHTNRIDP